MVACILSIRARDEVSLVAAQRLFTAAGTPEAIAALTPEQIDRLIGDCSFHEAKAYQIREIAQAAVEVGGEQPCRQEALLELRGVGPKCAHLALGIACGQQHISVDIHVHRIVNRWGMVRERTPEETMRALQELLPAEFWIEINALLVPSGKHVCTGRLPACSSCAVLEFCRQVGVEKYR